MARKQGFYGSWIDLRFWPPRFEGIRRGRPPISLESQFATTLATFRALDSLRSGAVEPVKIQEL